MVKFPSTDVEAEEICGTVRDEVNAFVGFVTKSKTKFPGPNPVSISRADFEKLRKDAYWMSAKTDGVRAVLVCLRVGSVDYVLFMDRSRKYYALAGNPFSVCTAWFEGTILDGEIVGKEFRIFDALFVSGANVGHLRFSTRRMAMRSGLDMHRASQKVVPPLALVEKEFVLPSEFAVASASEIGADGIVCMPENAPYVCGRHMTLFKLKTHHTVDFRVGPDASIFVQEKGLPVPVGRLDLPVGCTSPPIDSIVECEPVDDGTGKISWRPVSVRTDKNYPNDVLTFKSTLRDIREGISYVELVNFAVDLEKNLYSKNF